LRASAREHRLSLRIRIRTRRLARTPDHDAIGALRAPAA
jgi:hypothetical protein